MQAASWDEIVIGGSTAASLQEIGDFHLSPYRIYAPRRINSCIATASFATASFVTRPVNHSDVTWVTGIPVTRPERTLVDLCLDYEAWSLVEDAFVDAKNIDCARLGRRLNRPCRKRPPPPWALLPHVQ